MLKLSKSKSKNKNMSKTTSNNQPVNSPLTNCPDLGQLVNAEIE